MLQVRLRLGEVVKRLVVHGLSYSCVFSIILVRTYIKAQKIFELYRSTTNSA